MKILDRLAHAWNAFVGNESNWQKSYSYGSSYSYRPDRVIVSRGAERSIVNSIYNRISVDVVSVKIRHVLLDDNDRYVREINTYLNNCFKVEANIDQSAQQFLLDAVMSMLDEGCVALVPIDTTLNPNNTSSYDIETLRVGKILQWYPQHIQVEAYNERIGRKQQIFMPKKDVAIIENPFYSVMNAPNSTLQRLIRKLAILDAIDEHSGSEKLDLIIQLPYMVKTDARKKQAEQRRLDIQEQLANSKYGIAYTDGTEHITQLNRPVENNILKSIEYLTNMLFSQLGITQSILDGTADEKTMLNYENRIIIPIVKAIVDEMNRKFLTKTARTKKQAIMYFNDPFRYVQITNLAEIADKFTRNEIMTSNELRQVIGIKPSDDPNADELRNKNLNSSEAEAPTTEEPVEEDTQEVEQQTVNPEDVVQLF